MSFSLPSTALSPPSITSGMEPPYAASPPTEGTATVVYSDEVITYFQDDGVWLLSCSFAIWTMVSGFGLLESGRVSSKDEVNIMVKNVVDVVFGGLSYWAFGFGFTFGDLYPNPVIGIGKFFFDADDGDYPLKIPSTYYSTSEAATTNPHHQAWRYSTFFFQMSFATTTATIVSAAMAERIRLRPYMVITMLMTLLHSIAAHWVWSSNGFLYRMGCVDAAGCSVVHLVGGVAGLASTLYLRPRQARFGASGRQTMSNPTNALLGTFMLWWGWLAFNTGTTYGVAQGRWRLAARSAVVTVMSSVGGGCTAIFISLMMTKKCQVDHLIDGLLASLVATTAICHSIRPFEAVVVGTVGSALALATYPLIERLEIDDPVGVISVHVVGATWGMLSVGLLAHEDRHGLNVTKGRNGLLYGGGVELLAVQALCIVVIFAWALGVTLLALFTIDQLPWGLRMTKYEEQLGADLVEHGLAGDNIAKYSVERNNTNMKAVSLVVNSLMRWKRAVRRAREQRIQLADELRQQGVDPSVVLPPNLGLAAILHRRGSYLSKRLNGSNSELLSRIDAASASARRLRLQRRQTTLGRFVRFGSLASMGTSALRRGSVPMRVVEESSSTGSVAPPPPPTTPNGAIPAVEGDAKNFVVGAIEIGEGRRRDTMEIEEVRAAVVEIVESKKQLQQQQQQKQGSSPSSTGFHHPDESAAVIAAANYSSSMALPAALAASAVAPTTVVVSKPPSLLARLTRSAAAVGGSRGKQQGRVAPTGSSSSSCNSKGLHAGFLGGGATPAVRIDEEMGLGSGGETAMTTMNSGDAAAADKRVTNSSSSGGRLALGDGEPSDRRRNRRLSPRSGDERGGRGEEKGRKY